MSQIALAYVLPADRFRTNLPDLIRKKKWKEFWTELNQLGTTITPAYGYSGYNLLVLFDYWDQKHNIKAPMNLAELNLSGTAIEEVAMAICANRSEAKSFLEKLTSLTTDEAELYRYFTEFSGADWDEA